VNASPDLPEKHAPLPKKAIIATLLVGALFLFLLARMDTWRQQLSEALMFIPDSYQTPVKAISPPKPPFLGGVLLLHGYGGSKETMQSLAIDLALEGFYTFSLDLPGCGDSQRSYSRKELLPAVESAYKNLLGRALLTPGKIAIIGHSMGGGLALQFAREHPEVQATVLLSSVPGLVTPEAPRNLLLITAENDLPNLRQAAGRMLQEAAAGKNVPAGVTVGDMAGGTARRAVEAPGANHLTILYSEFASRETRAWLRQALKPGTEAAAIASHSPQLAWFLAAALLLFFPLLLLALFFLPPAAERLEISRLQPAREWGILAAAAVSGSLAAAFLPTSRWIPIHMVDYVATSLALSGVAITLCGLVLGVRVAWSLPPWKQRVRPLLLAAGSFLFFYWNIGLAVNDYWLRMSLSGGRWEIAARAALLLAPMIFAQELVTRELQQRRGYWRACLASAATNLLLLIGLLIPALLRLGSVDAFLMMMSAPFLAAFFLIIPLLAGWLFHASRSVLFSATWTTLTYAWLFTATPFWN
jgi:pimeloyl-ACP methyl ester carboxylesterase